MDTQSNEEWKAELDEIVATFEAREAENPGNANKTSDISPKDLARYFDHTVLKLDATEGDVDKLCSEAKENGFAVSHVI
jgi:deoxyribose-phosphate aldolase